jgi:NYN domain
MNPKDPSAQPVRLAWRTLPGVLLGELPAIIGTAEHLVYKGTHLFASVDPRPKNRDEGFKRYLHWLSQQTGYQVKVRDRRPKKDSCPHCTRKIDRMVEKGVDADIVSTLYEGAINNSYDIALLLSNEADHTPAIRTIQDRLNKQSSTLASRRAGRKYEPLLRATYFWTAISPIALLKNRALVRTRRPTLGKRARRRFKLTHYRAGREVARGVSGV